MVGSFEELRDSKEKGAAVDVVDPKGGRVFDLKEASTAQNVQFTMAGFYDIRRPNGRNELVAVNSDRRESDLTPATTEDLKLWQNTANGTSGGDSSATSEQSRFRYGGTSCWRHWHWRWRSRCWGIDIFRWIKRRHETFRSLVRLFDRSGTAAALAGFEPRRAVSAAAALILTVLAVLAGQSVRLLAFERDGRARVPVPGVGVGHCGGAHRAGDQAEPPARASAAESKYPQFQERLLTFTERMEQNPGDPFLPLLADDTLAVATQATPKQVARSSWIFSFSSAAVVCAAILIWLGVYGGGFLGYGTSLLWGGIPKGALKPFYNIQVDPGNRTVRKRADQLITATLNGFSAPKCDSSQSL
jgi:hypothetical protein